MDGVPFHLYFKKGEKEGGKEGERRRRKRRRKRGEVGRRRGRRRRKRRGRERRGRGEERGKGSRAMPNYWRCVLKTEDVLHCQRVKATCTTQNIWHLWEASSFPLLAQPYHFHTQGWLLEQVEVMGSWAQAAWFSKWITTGRGFDSCLSSLTGIWY